MDNIGTIFYERSGLVGARLTDNDASTDLTDDKTQWKDMSTINTSLTISSSFAEKIAISEEYPVPDGPCDRHHRITHATNHRFQRCRQERR